MILIFLSFFIMIGKSKLYLVTLVFYFFLIVCSDTNKESSESINNRQVQKEDLLRANRFLAGKDMELIKAYVNRRNWDIEFTETGLGYQIFENGSGMKVEKGMLITMEYSLSLLDGRLCYSSGQNGPKSFKVGQGGVEAGLEEGVLMLREGDKARFIMPSFLAHGLIGDQNKIPPRAVIIYEVEITDVSDI